jgi:2-oxoglutarate dehydrogenase E2 component (dihydrolipoamide succinyltransferase)
MATDIIVPPLGESVTEATVARWLKQPGDAVAVDDPLVELETDKVTLEVNAPAAGTLAEVLVPKDGNVAVGGVLGRIADGKGKSAARAEGKPAPSAAPTPAAPPPQLRTPMQAPQPKVEPPSPPPAVAKADAEQVARSGPAVRRLVEETKVEPSRVAPTGRDGRLTKGDVLTTLEKGAAASAPAAVQAAVSAARETGPREERVRMTRLRRRIAERLKEAQNVAAMLTTFNEADMSAVIGLRERYRESFEKKHGIRLGFMSFFVKACIVALKEIPAANAEIDGEDIVYKNHYDIGVAVGTEQGLVVPVVRDADRLDFADIEKQVGDLGRRARDGKLKLEELSGGTFTITNGGVYGSLMSTPILNPPQAAILGMHKIQQRPVVVDGQVVARPMMYLALSYDHRLVDGREAVTFLVRVKECIEDPERLLFGV